jgi:4-diphosphocytidyl-2-C-methyl-D-erythritol kinase
MVFFPNCKINLGLKILRRRDDGFHDLETIFYPLPLRDILEVVRASSLQFSASGRSVPGDRDANLVIRAYDLLKKDFPELPFVHIHLHKRIPIGAGLGGGSSDGAFLLKLLDREFQLGLTSDRLLGYAEGLGSDCPFFLLNQPCLGEGRGERLEPFPLDLSGYSFLLVHPGIHISTARAFSLCRPDDSGPSLRTVIARPIAEWRGALVNDFETPVFQEYPVLRQIKESLYERGALYAALSGSGSSLFGIFEKGKADRDGWAEGHGWGEGVEVISIMEKK